MRRKREPSDLEVALWRRAMHDVRPKAPPDEPDQADARASLRVEPEPATPPADSQSRTNASERDAPKPRTSRAPSNDIERRTLQRLRRGLYPVSARLDLHGLTQEEAWTVLSAFLARAQERGLRCVLVITGTGARTGGGILRAMVPRWLATPPNGERVHAFAPAGRAHGGEGALYVLLRRRR